MKKAQKLLLTLLIAALAMPAMALASEPTAEGTEVSVALEEEIALPDDGEAPAEEGTPEAAQPDGEAVTVYNFIVENALLAAQEAREGDAILRPDDPAAPGGYVFAGWYLEDGTALFVDGDGDGEIDAVIAHPDPQMPDVNVFARFVEAEEKPSPDGEGTEAEEPSVEEEATAEPQKPSPEGNGTEAEEPSVEEATAEPQKPSPDGEGGATAPDEVSSPDATNAEGEGENAETSSVSPDAATEGAYQPDLAENSPLESFPGAAVSPKGEASEPTQKPSPDGEGGATAPDEVSSPDDMNAEDEGEDPETSSVTADAATEGAYQPDLAENSPLESFPGAAVSPKGEALEAEEPSVEENTEDTQEPSVEDEGADEAAPALPTANALTYTGEAQALVSGEGWLYSLDGETYSEAIPTGINAGEYIVYFKAAGDAEPQTLLVTIAKADVVFTEPVAAATGD